MFQGKQNVGNKHNKRGEGLYVKIIKMAMEETEEDTSQGSHVHGKEVDIVKTSVHAAKSNLQINCKPHQNPNKFFTKLEKLIPESLWNDPEQSLTIKNNA